MYGFIESASLYVYARALYNVVSIHRLSSCCYYIPRYSPAKDYDVMSGPHHYSTLHYWTLPTPALGHQVQLYRIIFTRHLILRSLLHTLHSLFIEHGLSRLFIVTRVWVFWWRRPTTNDNTATTTTHVCTHLTHSLTHLLTHSFVQSFVHSFIHSFHQDQMNEGSKSEVRCGERLSEWRTDGRTDRRKKEEGSDKWVGQEGRNPLTSTCLHLSWEITQSHTDHTLFVYKSLRHNTGEWRRRSLVCLLCTHCVCSV